MGAGAAGVLPQLLLYKSATGLWLPSPYGAIDAGFTFSSPHLYDVLFGTQKGLFFWHPALLFAVAGWIVARGWASSLVWAAGVVLSINTFLIASWFDWQFGGSYGHRGFTDGFVLAAVFMAAFFSWVGGQRHRAAAIAATAACATLAVSLSVAQMIQYWMGVLPIAEHDVGAVPRAVPEIPVASGFSRDRPPDGVTASARACWTIFTPALAPDARRARGNHGVDAVEVAHAAGRLDAHLGAHHAAHQRHVGRRRAAGPEPGRRLDVVGAGRLRQRARRHLLVVGQQRGLDDDLAQDVAVAARQHHGLDVAFDDAEVAGLQGADVDDGVDLAGAVEDRALRLVPLHVGGRRAQREADHRAHADAAAGEQPRAQGDPGRVHAHRREPELRRLAAEVLDVLTRGVGLEQRVVDHRRDTRRRPAERVDADAGGPRVDHRPQPIGTAVAQDAVARARRHGTARRRRGRRHLGHDDVDQPLQLVPGHLIGHLVICASRSRIFASRRMYRGSRIEVVSQVVTMARASSGVTSVAPSASTFAPLCSRE